jgi:hypothetical protein
MRLLAGDLDEACANSLRGAQGILRWLKDGPVDWARLSGSPPTHMTPDVQLHRDSRWLLFDGQNRKYRLDEPFEQPRTVQVRFVDFGHKSLDYNGLADVKLP